MAEPPGGGGGGGGGAHACGLAAATEPPVRRGFLRRKNRYAGLVVTGPVRVPVPSSCHVVFIIIRPSRSSGPSSVDIVPADAASSTTATSQWMANSSSVMNHCSARTSWLMNLKQRYSAFPVPLNDVA
uniref:Uncharacterized protein n=1 Tax=Oryza glumipatula TaxID=40148 RepID=A0A0D9ZWE9_9ORYZ